MIQNCANALSTSKGSAVILYSPSGDTDINVLATALLQNYKSRLFIEYSYWINNKGCWLKDSASSSALLGLHTFTGNDFVTSFFKKGKLKRWKILQKFRKFENCFSQLGAELD